MNVPPFDLSVQLADLGDDLDRLYWMYCAVAATSVVQSFSSSSRILLLSAALPMRWGATAEPML